MTPEDLEYLNKYVSKGTRPEKIIAIGVGGGGGNAVNHMCRLGIENVALYVANTDKQALDNSPVPNKILLGPNVTKGRGAGNIPDVARQAAEESAEDVSDIFMADTDMAFITAGMGGGTGTGAAPVIARIAREKGILTVGIVTIPFMFEGTRKIKKALEGAQELARYTDALLVINNNRLSEIYPDYTFENAFEKADDILSTAASSISEIITKHGKMNLDFNDVNTTLRDGGTAIISIGYGEGEHRVTKAIQDALNSPLLKETDVYSSKRLLFNLYYSPTAQQKFKAGESDEFTSFVTKMVTDVDVIWGITYDESLGDKVKVTILAAGFDVTVHGGSTSKGEGQRETPVVKIEGRPEDNNQDTTDIDLIIDYYGPSMINVLESKETQRFIILNPEDLNDDEMIRRVESLPAYKRDMRELSNMRVEAIIGKTTLADKPADEQAKKPSAGRVIDFSADDM